MKKLILAVILLVANHTNAAFVTLTWDPAVNASGYQVWRATNGGAFALTAWVQATSVSAPVDTNVTTLFYVFSTNSAGSSFFPSNTVTNSPSVVIPPPPPPPPPPPVGTITISAPVMSSTNLVPGQTVTGSATFKNGTSAAFFVSAGTLSSRQPGTSNASGPFYNWTPDVGIQTIPAGVSLAVSQSWVVPTNAVSGQWRTYLSVRNAATGAYSDGPDTLFQVGGAILLPPPAPTNLRGVFVP